MLKYSHSLAVECPHQEKCRVYKSITKKPAENAIVNRRICVLNANKVDTIQEIISQLMNQLLQDRLTKTCSGTFSDF